MEKNLILTGWGRSDYAVAAAVALRVVGAADVLGVSMRRLADALVKESVGREAVYVLGVGLGNEAEAFAEAARRLAANGTAVSYLSMFKMDGDVRGVMESASVRLGVFTKAKSLAEVAEMFFDVEAGDLHPYAIERKEGESSSAAKYQGLFRAAGYIHRTNGDDSIYAESIRSLAACIKPEAWPQSLSGAINDYRKYGKRELLGHSSAMEEVRRRIDLAAKHPDARVLILGDSGTGKETVAQQIHRKSLRESGDFVAFNCASVTPNLLEGRLFGYEKGAYTDASRTTDGLFEKAKGGTLFLDEIGELPLEAQGLLLRVLQENKFQRLGGADDIVADVRLITATNRNLARMVREGKFRRDLFQRLCVIQIVIPPLRERKEDIASIADSWWYANNCGKHLTKKQIADLQEFDYEGNVRELINLLERALVLEEEDFAKVIAEYREMNAGLFAEEAKGADGELPMRLDDAIRVHVRRIYEANGCQIAATARALGVSPNTVKNRLRFDGSRGCSSISDAGPSEIDGEGVGLILKTPQK